ncbi:IS5 family transposase [Acinetobacter baumannii]|uniref:IS5 family transposase n=1 Tax=Acinetobacter baumannii TaxID=470 RepID=UPI00241FE74B|nr:IS5 family transposase [Acinetobacter baumannii]MDG5658889.1 IS5 family transposase [Acinetobacter baumannii]MDQ8773735.1 IS5 family transposase [Acinetobacter baumannii]
MAWKQTGQLSLADSLINAHKAIEELDELHNLIDWQTIEQPYATFIAVSVGNLPFTLSSCFKVLLLQKLYNLSDPAMEKQLARDLLFRRFVGLSLTDDVPDHSTIWRYHKHLGELRLIEPLFNQINEQLAQQNIFIKAGSVSIIDASIVEAKNKRPKKGKHTDNTQDNEAAYVSKKDSTGKVKTTYGFKIHLNCDEDSFVKKVETTPANVHDSQCFTTLLTDDESAVYADSAYKKPSP